MEIVVPGQRLGVVSQFKAGEGTYTTSSHIHASVIGTISRKDGVIRVNRIKPAPPVPRVGTLILGQITHLTTAEAIVEIRAVDNRPVLQNSFRGVLRIQDIFPVGFVPPTGSSSTGEVGMVRWFRPGDIVRCAVLSLGDASSYYLTTGRNELGVIMARCESSGERMRPIGWDRMQCPLTTLIESRKVAKP
jgi:exosome complex component CSL4